MFKLLWNFFRKLHWTHRRQSDSLLLGNPTRNEFSLNCTICLEHVESPVLSGNCQAPEDYLDETNMRYCLFVPNHGIVYGQRKGICCSE